jgi:predicted DNA-binding transcriptional regulator AlpA
MTTTRSEESVMKINKEDGPVVPSMMTTAEVAQMLKVAPSTLCRWRAQGVGPRVCWLGMSTPRYRTSDVLAWLDGVAA